MTDYFNIYLDTLDLKMGIEHGKDRFLWQGLCQNLA